MDCLGFHLQPRFGTSTLVDFVDLPRWTRRTLRSFDFTMAPRAADAKEISQVTDANR